MLCTLMYKALLYYWYAKFWISLDYVDTAACNLRMKQHYNWYFSSSCNEINAFWKYHLWEEDMYSIFINRYCIVYQVIISVDITACFFEFDLLD